MLASTLEQATATGLTTCPQDHRDILIKITIMINYNN